LQGSMGKRVKLAMLPSTAPDRMECLAR
jgi:hypothetical protein